MITGSAISCNIINKIRETAIKKYRISFPFHPNPSNFKENMGILRIINILMISVIAKRGMGCSKKTKFTIRRQKIFLLMDNFILPPNRIIFLICYSAILLIYVCFVNNFYNINVMFSEIFRKYISSCASDVIYVA